MIRTASLAVLGALFALSAPLSASGVATGSQVELVPVLDNTLFNDPAGGTSNGSGPVFFVGRSGGMFLAERRGVVRFDFATIPAGSTITDVRLDVTIRQTSSGPQPVAFHRLLADWGEGASSAVQGSGAPSEPGDATWIHTFFPGSLWANPGGDFVPAASGSGTLDAIGPNSIPGTAGMVADVQAWLDGAQPNFGWILIGDESMPGTTKSIWSRQHSVPAERPRLVVDFTPPPPTSYCTAGTTTNGCTASMSAAGTASASPGSGFALTCSGLEGATNGILFYGLSGPNAAPWQGGTSRLCVRPPVQRMGLANAGGTPGACDGTITVDWNAFVQTPGRLGTPFAGGETVWAQCWFRDPPNAPTSALSDGITFAVTP